MATSGGSTQAHNLPCLLSTERGNRARPRTAAILALSNEPDLQVVAGCADGLGARLVEEAGFRIGFAIAVRKPIRINAQVGAAAVLIEDKQWPRLLGNEGAKLVVGREEARLRYRAWMQAARAEEVLLLARTDARGSRGFEEPLARLRNFIAEGADVFFLDSPMTKQEMRGSVDACQGKPALAGPGGPKVAVGECVRTGDSDPIG
jgi:2-methylisocitrate lyase-like PEP mutase family enzyme